MKFESKEWIVEVPWGKHPVTQAYGEGFESSHPEYRRRGQPYDNEQMARTAAAIYNGRVVERITITTERVVENYADVS